MTPEHYEQRADRGSNRLWTGLGRGFRRKCPNCGHGLAFSGYLKLRDKCDCCEHPIGEYRCDDAPPYFTILLVGHIVVAGALSMEQASQPSMATQLSIWLPATIILSLAILPFMKGMVLGTQWAMKIKG